MESQNSTDCLPSQELTIVPLELNSSTLCMTGSDEETGKVPSRSTDSMSSFRRNFFSKLIDEIQEYYSTEMLQRTIFIAVMATISNSLLLLGIELLEKTGLSYSISPIVMSFLKYSLAAVSNHSVRQVANEPHLLKITVLSTRQTSCLGLTLTLARFLAPIHEIQKKIFSIIIGISCMVFLGGHFSRHKIHECLIKLCLCLLIETMVLPIIARVDISSDLALALPVINASVLVVSSEFQHYSSSFANPVLCFMDESIKKLLPFVVARVNCFMRILKEKKKIQKFIRYAVGLVGTVLFQNFFKLTSYNEVKAFLYLATSWLAGRSLANTLEDFGVLNFLLGNMILGSTVSQSGLGSTTWFTCGVCLLLYALQLNLKSVSSPNVETMQIPPFYFWTFYFCTIIESVHSLVSQL